MASKKQALKVDQERLLIPLHQVKEKLENQRESLFKKGCKLNKFLEYVVPRVSHHMPLINQESALLEDDYFDEFPINPKFTSSTKVSYKPKAASFGDKLRLRCEFDLNAFNNYKQGKMLKFFKNKPKEEQVDLT